MKKIWMYLRWFLVIGPVGLIGLLGFIIFPFAWLLRSLGKWSPFWIWMDDTRFNKDGTYASDYKVQLELRGLEKENFKVAYYWHANRNRAWNLLELFKVPDSTFENGNGNNDIEVTKYIIDDLKKYDGTKLPQGDRWVIMAGLKFVPTNPTQDPWQVNNGDVLSNNTSIIGTGYIRYKVGQWESWRYSHAKIINYNIFGLKIWEGWRTIKLGTNSNRYSITIKHQKIKPWDINI